MRGNFSLPLSVSYPLSFHASIHHFIWQTSPITKSHHTDLWSTTQNSNATTKYKTWHEIETQFPQITALNSNEIRSAKLQLLPVKKFHVSVRHFKFMVAFQIKKKYCHAICYDIHSYRTMTKTTWEVKP